MNSIKAVIFDMGGVFIKYPEPQFFEKIFKLAESDENMKKIIEDFELGNTWMGEIATMIREISDEEMKKKISGEMKVIKAMTEQKSLDQNFIIASKVLKEKGFKTALLTNNGWKNEEKSESFILDDLSLFDVVVESCKIKLRKPHPDIYLHTVKLLGLKPEECVFVDDLEPNIKGAEKLGMKAVQVVLGDSETAIKNLENIVGITLKA